MTIDSEPPLKPTLESPIITINENTEIIIVIDF